MNLKKLFPFSYSFIAEHTEEVTRFFIKKCPRKGNFISVSVLEGSFMCPDAEDVYNNLQIGEKLSLVPDSKLKRNKPVLAVMRENGTYIGILPSPYDILPNMLFSYDINVWCYLEAKSYDNSILELAVSIHCEDY